MKSKDLAEQLLKNPEAEVRIMNTRIEDNENCPTFPVESVELIKTCKDGEMITLQFADGDYLNEEFDIEN